MADVKISALPLASTPLAGTEVLPIVQSATTDQVSVANLTAGRAVSAASLTLTTTPLAVGSGGTGLPSLTAGYIPFGGSTTYSSDSNLFWDNTNKRLGVGTATPASILHVNSTAAIVRPYVTATTGYVDWQVSSTGGNFYFGIDNSAGGISGTAYGRHLYSDGAYPLDFFTNATKRMTLDASGNLSLGYTAPNSRLGIFNSQSDGAQTCANAGLLFGQTGGWAQAGIWPLGGAGFAGSLVFGTVPSGSTFTVTEKMRITSAGTVNIVGAGTAGSTQAVSFSGSAPASSMVLDANGNLALNTTTNGITTQGTGIFTVNGSTGYGQFCIAGDNAIRGPNAGYIIGNTNSNTFISGIKFNAGSASSGYIGFFVNGNTGTNGASVTIDPSGNLLVGTTSTGTGGNGFKVQPAGNGAGIPITILSGNTNNDANGAYHVYSTSDAAYKFYATYAGKIYAVTTTVQAITSDVNLKTDIQDYDYGLAEVCSMKPRYFRYKTDLTTRHAGFIAQEMDEAIPGSMIDAIDGKNKTYSADWYPILVKAIQELAAKVTELEAKI